MRVLRCCFLALMASCGDTADEPGALPADVSAPEDVAATADPGAPDLTEPEDLTPIDDPGTPEPDLAVPPDVLPDVPPVPDLAPPEDLGDPDEGADVPEEAPEILEPPPPDDQDGDGVPDEVDIAPDDSSLPGVALAGLVYAHTSSALYTMGMQNYTVVQIGAFDWPQDGGGHQMTDLAINGYGVLYGVTFDRLYTCHPLTAKCTSLATLPGSFNGLTFVPEGVLEADKEVLIGVTQVGGWFRLDIVDGKVQSTSLGSYGGGYGSAGDAFSIDGVGTFAAVNAAAASNLLVIVDPATGKVTSEVGPLTGYSTIYGLAGTSGRAFAFDASGAILVIDTKTAVVTLAANAGVPWWGAGVRTILK